MIHILKFFHNFNVSKLNNEAWPNILSKIRLGNKGRRENQNMSETDTNEIDQMIDVEDKWMWGTVTFNFIKEHVTNNIVSLNLASNHITLESAKILADHIKSPTNLKYLNISETRLTQRATDLIFASIGESSLLEFYADNNVFPELQCKILADSLIKNPPLQVLSLCACDIPCEGGVAIAEALPSNKNLLHLRLESNSLYETAAFKFGETLPESSLISLNIADNEIWSDGMNSILKCLKSTKIESLDISYNIFDVNTFCTEMNKTNIKELAVSGCKINEQLFPSFLAKIPSLHLNKLIIDGFNFQILPISWQRMRDSLWGTRTYFDDLLLALQQSPDLCDLRVGFLEMEQIFGIKGLLEDQPPRTMIISMHDFGHTDNCWIVHLPELKFEAPISTFRWNGTITNDNCRLIGEIIKNTVVVTSSIDEQSTTEDKSSTKKENDKNKSKGKKLKTHHRKNEKSDDFDVDEENLNNEEEEDELKEDEYNAEEEDNNSKESKESDNQNDDLTSQFENNLIHFGLIDTINLHDMKLEDDTFGNLLESLQGFNLNLLDCSDNNLGDASLEAIRNFLRNTTIEELDFSGNASSDLGCETFVRKMMEDGITFPSRLNLCFKSTDLNQTSEHSTPVRVAELIKSNAKIESLYIGGPVTAVDALCIVDAIPYNSHIVELEFQSDHIKNYMSPDPEINQDVQQSFLYLVSILHSALTDKKSLCKLKSFIFPMLTEVYIYDKAICEKWQEIEKKLQENEKGK